MALSTTDALYTISNEIIILFIPRLIMDPLDHTEDLLSSPNLLSEKCPDLSPGKLFVGGLSWQTCEDKLQEYFQQFGQVEDVLIMKDPITQVK